MAGFVFTISRKIRLTLYKENLELAGNHIWNRLRTGWFSYSFEPGWFSYCYCIIVVCSCRHMPIKSYNDMVLCRYAHIIIV